MHWSEYDEEPSHEKISVPGPSKEAPHLLLNLSASHVIMNDSTDLRLRERIKEQRRSSWAPNSNSGVLAGASRSLMDNARPDARSTMKGPGLKVPGLVR